jgi:hypothetical protein
MDPFSILGIIGTCLTVSARLVSIGADLHAIQQAWAATDADTEALLIEIDTLSIAAKKIAHWLTSPQGETLAEDERRCLARNLKACSSGTERLQSHVARVRRGSQAPDLRGKFRHWWHDGEVQSYQTALTRQIQALSFLLQTLQLYAYTSLHGPETTRGTDRHQIRSAETA